MEITLVIEITINAWINFLFLNWRNPAPAVMVSNVNVIKWKAPSTTLILSVKTVETTNNWNVSFGIFNRSKLKGKPVIGATKLLNMVELKKISDVIVANRLSDDILDVESKVYTRDIFGSD